VAQITLKVLAASDDAFRRISPSYFTLNGNAAGVFNAVGRYDTTNKQYGVGLRMTHADLASVVTALATATIDSAYLRVRAKAIESGTTTAYRSRIQGELTPTPATFANDSGVFDTRRADVTTASVDWDAPAAWVGGTWYNSPDIASIVTELKGQASWDGSMDLFHSDWALRQTTAGLLSYYDYELDSASAPELVINYTAGTTEPPATPTNLAIALNYDTGVLTCDAMATATSYKWYVDGTLLATTATPTYTNGFDVGAHTWSAKATNAIGDSAAATVVDTVTIFRGLRWEGRTDYHNGGTYLPNNVVVAFLRFVGTGMNKVIDWHTFELGASGLADWCSGDTVQWPTGQDTDTRWILRRTNATGTTTCWARGCAIRFDTGGFVRITYNDGVDSHWWDGDSWADVATNTAMAWSQDTDYYCRIVLSGSTFSLEVGTNADYSSPTLTATIAFASVMDAAVNAFGNDANAVSRIKNLCYNYRSVADFVSDGETITDMWGSDSTGLKDNKQMTCYRLANGMFLVSWMISKDHSSPTSGSQGWWARFASDGTMLRGPHLFDWFYNGGAGAPLQPVWVQRSTDGRIWAWFNVKMAAGTGTGTGQRDDAWFTYSDNNGLSWSAFVQKSSTANAGSRCLRCNGIEIENGTYDGDILVPAATNYSWVAPSSDIQGCFRLAAGTDGAAADDWDDYVAGTNGVAHTSTSAGTEPTLAEVPPATCTAQSWPSGTIVMLGRDDLDSNSTPLYARSYDGGQTFTTETYATWQGNPVRGTVGYAGYNGPSIISAVTDFTAGKIIVLNNNATDYSNYPLVKRTTDYGYDAGTLVQVDDPGTDYAFGESTLAQGVGGAYQLVTLVKYDRDYTNASYYWRFRALFSNTLTYPISPPMGHGLYSGMGKGMR
jgi:hypothetical protein